MLPKKQRLARKDFEPVLRGRSYASASFTLKTGVLDKNGSIKPKFSVVVSKKVANAATDRNKITRRTYEALRAAQKITAPPALSMAAFMKASSKNASLKELTAEFIGVFGKIRYNRLHD